jgi:hypothetical protein
VHLTRDEGDDVTSHGNTASASAANGKTAAAREIGLRVLRMTDGYEGFTSDDRARLSVAGLVGRARRLVRAAFLLADSGYGLEAAVLLRSLTEYVFTLAWLEKDIELNLRRWLYDGLTRVLEQDTTARRAARRRRREAGLDDATEADEPLGLLIPEIRTRMITARNALAAELAAIQDLDARLEPRSERDERPALSRAKSLPSFRTRAAIGGLGDHYDLGYTFDSLAVAHPNSLAAEQLLVRGVDGPAVNSEPARLLPDPFAVGTALLIVVADLGGELIPELAIPAANEILAELQAIKPFAARTTDEAPST